MSRREELEKIKEVIKETYDMFDCGIFSTRNVVGDEMEIIYSGKYFTLEGCYGYSYYELFGTTEEEFEEVVKLCHELYLERKIEIEEV